MFKPKYTLSSKILNNLAVVERYYGRLEAMQIPKELELKLERDNLTESTYVSNSIEGNPLTLPEVTNLILKDRVPANRDEKEVKSFFAILKDLDKYARDPVSISLILKLHGELLDGINEQAGSIRNEIVAVGRRIKEGGGVNLKVKHIPPFHQRQEIEKAMRELADWLNKKTSLPTPIKAGIFHHQFVYIHPFEDGNGRVCRLLTTLIFLKSSYQINKYFILDDYYDIDRILYSDKLHSADNGDKTEWLEYFTEGVMYSLQSALSRIKEGFNNLKIEIRPTTKERQVIEVIKTQREITAPELAKKLRVSRQQAHNLLKSLIKKGLVSKKGKTKSSYYFLK